MVFEGHKEGVWSATYSSDGKTILTGSPDRSLILWDPKKSKPIATLKEHKNKVYYAKFNENNT